jgi:hypothetical protein
MVTGVLNLIDLVKQIYYRCKLKAISPNERKIQQVILQLPNSNAPNKFCKISFTYLATVMLNFSCHKQFIPASGTCSAKS